MSPSKDVYARLEAAPVDVSVLGEKLTFRNGRTAQNRFLKVSCSNGENKLMGSERPQETWHSFTTYY
ncbi:hypothetical protein Y032_0081g1458 [Ancylostoma ceylanicum]|uniref:Uncharacterized protein n=1 Tax=Ancylostoma ceylanicum TaxID=53326 RepID=A0A016TS49_9BILA|nr:hypothetical protein Y032_0081g1458 [Ancylostoma ceylanicum]